MSTSPKKLVVIMKEIVARKHLLTHPFYKLWTAGKLPKEALQKYTGQYFHLVDNLPKFISTLHSNCDNEQTRIQLIKNLMEEELGEGNGNIAHTQLWLDFAEELGVERNEAMSAELLPATKNAVNTIKKACQQSMAQGSAALYAYESQVPEISVEKIKGLKEYYNIASVKALRFFEVHKDADIKHRAVWTALSNKYATTCSVMDAILQVIMYEITSVIPCAITSSVAYAITYS